MTEHSKALPSAWIVEKAAIRWFSAVSFLFFASVVYGQAATGNQSPPVEPVQAPGITTNVNEVSLDIAVHDRRHNLVTDLKPEDLVVTDDNVPVKLTGFHLVSGDAAAARGHVVTFLFDSFHGPTARSARIIAERVLGVLPTAGYSFAVLEFANRLTLMQSFSDDRPTVEQAIHVVTESQPITATSALSLDVTMMNDRAADEARMKASTVAEKNMIAVAQTGVDVAGRHVGAKERSLAQTLLTALNDSQSNAQEEKTGLSFAGLLALVRSQQTIGERKVIIYFTQNRQLDKDSKKMLETISGAAAQAGVTIYTVDMEAIAPGGKQLDNANLHAGQQQFVDKPQQPNATPAELVPQGPPPGAGSAGGVQNGGFGSGGYVWTQQDDIRVMTDFSRNGPEDLTDPFADSKSPLADFSKATGGAYIDGQNSTKKPLEQMVQDLTTYYQASYVPPFTDYDGKFRTIHVKPLRTGMEIQTKTGYFALAADAEGGIQPFEAPLLKALAEPELPTGLKFHAAVLRFGDLPDGNTSTIGVEVPIAELEAKRDAKSNLSSAHVSIVVQIKDVSGTVIEHYSKDITKRGAAETLDRDRTATLALERHFVTTPGKYTMEVAVLDQNSGKEGAERTEFEIPDRAGSLSLSDMVLVRAVDGAYEEQVDPLEPLRYGHRKVTPNLTGEMPVNDKDVSMFFILHPDPASSEPANLEMQLIHNGKAGRRIPLLHVDGERGPIPYLANVKSHALAPGVYEVKAFLSQGGKTTEESGTFRVAGTPGTEAANADSSWFEGASIGADTGDQPTAAPSKPPSELAIVALAKPVAAPTADAAGKLIEDARQRALDFNETLPNFTCTEVTKRSVDFSGDGKWRTRDTLTELLSYRERVETRTMLEVNGNASHTDRGAMKGVFSAGEFGGVLQAVFRDESKADFKWKETDSLNGGTVEVYDYHVDAGNSTFSVTGSGGKQVKVGFHGRVFIDSATRHARRVTLTADDLPTNFSTHATSIGVDYDYVPINGLKYLVPVSAELELKQGLHEAMVNTMEFRDYKRFGSNDPKPGSAPE